LSKSRKRCRVALAVLCLVAVLFSVFWFVPYLRLRVLRVPVESDLFLLPPDKVTVTYQGETFELDAVQRIRLYRLMEQMTQNATLEETPSVEDKAKDQKWSFEFHYDYRYYYTGGQYVGGQLFEHRFVFDTLSFGFAGDKLLINPSIWGVDYKINSESQCLMADITNVYNAMLSTYMEKMLCMPGKEQTNAENECVCDVFPALPDEIVISQNGLAKTLTGVELQTVYDVFVAMVQGHSMIVCRVPMTFDYAQETLLNSICIEFRYKNRQSYFSKQEKDPESDPLIDLIEVSYSGQKYDAILFAVQQTDEMINLVKAIYVDGAYQWRHMNSEQWGYDVEKMNALLDVIRMVW